MKGWVLSSLVTGAIAVTQASSAATAVPGDASEAKVRAALARHDSQDAAASFNALVEVRLPAKQSDRPDPLLDRLMIEQMVAQGQQPPLSILERLVEERTASDRPHNLLLIATAEESIGQEDRAQAHYLSALDDPRSTDDQRVSARLGLARLMFGSNPAEAAKALRSIDPSIVPVARRWEVDLQLARALTVSEPRDLASQAALFAKAWAEAPDADISDHAIARVSSDEAVAAARQGDRAKLIRLIALDRFNRNPNMGQNALASGLPICGEDGITEVDTAIIEVQRTAPSERPAINLVWANRPGSGRIFLNAARRSGQLGVPDGSVSQFALRCRATPSREYAVSFKLDDVFAGWMTAKGAYPLAGDLTTLSVTQLAAILADRTTRYGPTSIMRLPVLLQLVSCVAPQVAADEQARTRLNDLVEQVNNTIQANDAPGDIRLVWQIASVGMALATRVKAPAQAQVEIQGLLVAATNDTSASRDFLYGLASGMAQQPTASSAFKDAVLTATLKLFAREPRNDPRARALTLQLYRLRADNGDLAGAQTILTGYNFPADSCSLLGTVPHFVSSNIRSDDYPGDVLFAAIVGLTYMQFDLDAMGQAVNGRLLVSDPPYLFDDTASKGLTTIRYDAPRRDGKVEACRSMGQNVRWQLP